MRQVGAFEAKTHFSQLLAEVRQGKSVSITKHGKEVAMLVPSKKRITVDPVDEAIEGILELQKHTKLGPGLTIKQMIEEGRR